MSSFDFSDAEIPTGRTVPLVLDQLKGAPIVHVEFFGDTNKTWIAEQVAMANSPKESQKLAARRPGSKASEAWYRNEMDVLRERVARHMVRDLEATYNAGPRAGQKASKEDIPDFVAKIPIDVIKFIRDFCLNPNNFRQYLIEGDVEATAAKS